MPIGGASTKKPLFYGRFQRFGLPLRFRGTAIAIGTVTMENKTDLMPNVESKPALGSDWVDANADYLFNFAIGQVRDANTAEDLVQETFLAAVKAQTSFGGKSIAQPPDRVGRIPRQFGTGARQTAPAHRTSVSTLPNRRASEPRSLPPNEHFGEQSLGDAAPRPQAAPRATRWLVVR